MYKYKYLFSTDVDEFIITQVYYSYHNITKYFVNFKKIIIISHFFNHKQIIKDLPLVFTELFAYTDTDNTYYDQIVLTA